MKSFEIEEKIRREGEERGREEGIHGMIRTCRRFKQTDAQIVQLLQEELNLTREQAEDAWQSTHLCQASSACSLVRLGSS